MIVRCSPLFLLACVGAVAPAEPSPCPIQPGLWRLHYTLSSLDTDPDCPLTRPDEIAESDGNGLLPGCESDWVVECRAEPLDDQCVGSRSREYGDGDAHNSLDCTFERVAENELIGTCDAFDGGMMSEQQLACFYDFSAVPE